MFRWLNCVEPHLLQAKWCPRIANKTSLRYIHRSATLNSPISLQLNLGPWRENLGRGWKLCGPRYYPLALVTSLCPSLYSFFPPPSIRENLLASILHITCVWYHPCLGITFAGYFAIRILQELVKFLRPYVQIGLKVIWFSILTKV